MEPWHSLGLGASRTATCRARGQCLPTVVQGTGGRIISPWPQQGPDVTSGQMSLCPNSMLAVSPTTCVVPSWRPSALQSMPRTVAWEEPQEAGPYLVSACPPLSPGVSGALLRGASLISGCSSLPCRTDWVAGTPGTGSSPSPSRGSHANHSFLLHQRPVFLQFF